LEHPALRFNCLSTENDRREWAEVVRTARELLDQPTFVPFDDGEISPGPHIETDEQILDWVARDAETALHPSCTAKMGPASEPMAVVGPSTMEVNGARCLRLVDA